MGLNDRRCTQCLGRHRAQGSGLGLAVRGLARLLAARGLRLERTPPALTIPPTAPAAARFLALTRGVCRGLRFGDCLSDLRLGLRRFAPALATTTAALATLATFPTLPA